MRKLILIAIISILSIYTQAQCEKTNYDILIGEGDQLMANQEYLKAFCKYRAAKNICPTNNEKSRKKIAEVMDKIIQLKIDINPKATVGGKRGGKVTLFWLASQNGVSIEYPSAMDCDLGYVITGFTLSILDKQGNVYDAKSDGSTFSDKQKEIFRKFASPGQKVYFENIQAKRIDGLIINFGSLAFAIQY